MFTDSNFFIQEGVIFQEAEILKEDSKKVYFKACLQTINEINQNRRFYPESVLKSAMSDIDEKIKSRSLFNELDHPFKKGDRNFDIQRQTTVILEKVSHIVTGYEFRENKLIGQMETTRTPCGYILYGLIKDKTGVGFSMRGMGELETKGGYNEVKAPLTIICFDSVSNPSHKGAVVNFNEVRFESRMITESPDMICCNGYCFLPNYFDKLVEKQIITFADSWI
jgi:hypothetical protein